MRQRLAVLLLCAGALLLGATPARSQPLLGVFGNAARFHRLTGDLPAIRHVILGWDQGVGWGSPLDRLLPTLAPVPMIGLSTTSGWPGPREAITPLGIARGEGDSFLVALNRAVGTFPGERIYLRPLGEMNGHWNAYCAFRANRSAKGAAYSTDAFRKAFARIYLIAHGGPGVNASLRRLGLRPVRADLAANPMPRLRVIWNPQGYGSPNIAGNSAQAYYPGDAYVDVVGNDLYDQGFRAEWGANERLYRAHPAKPFAFPEWGLEGIDDPVFVGRMARFVRTHPRVELVSYFSAGPGSEWDLATKPRSLAAYRRLIAPLG